MSASQLAELITATIKSLVANANTTTGYREPLIGFASADDPGFIRVQQHAGPSHLLPSDLLPGARSLTVFFLPFASWVVQANSRHREQVAREWAVAYVETNALIGQITASLIALLASHGIQSVAEPATHNFDPASLTSRWSHKSVAVIAGLGSFGLHHMVITDAGCAGRFGSLILDADLPMHPPHPRERCLYFYDGSCLECVVRCPAKALSDGAPIDKQRCYARLLSVAQEFEQLGLADVCGKCAIGPCSLSSAVQ